MTKLAKLKKLQLPENNKSIRPCIGDEGPYSPPPPPIEEIVEEGEGGKKTTSDNSKM